MKGLGHVHTAITQLFLFVFLFFFFGARSIPLSPSLKDVLNKKKTKKKSEAGEILFRATECLLALFTVLFFSFFVPEGTRRRKL